MRRATGRPVRSDGSAWAFVASVAVGVGVLVVAILGLTFAVDWPGRLAWEVPHPLGARQGISRGFLLVAPPLVLAVLSGVLAVLVPVAFAEKRRAVAGGLVLAGTVGLLLAQDPAYCTDTIPPIGYPYGVSFDVAETAVAFGGHHEGSYACHVELSRIRLAGAHGLLTAGMALWIRPSAFDGVAWRIRRHLG